MDRIGSHVERELGKLGPGGSMAALVAVWPTAVGDDVARNAWPARVSGDGTLVVHTSSAAWAFELTQLAPMVLERLTTEAPGNAPKQLRFVVGPVPEPPSPAPQETEKTLAEPSAEAVSEAAEIAARIGDEELRARVARAAALSLERARDDRRF